MNESKMLPHMLAAVPALFPVWQFLSSHWTALSLILHFSHIQSGYVLKEQDTKRLSRCHVLQS